MVILNNICILMDNVSQSNNKLMGTALLLLLTFLDDLLR